MNKYWILTLMIVFISSCSLSENEIYKNKWKYNFGDHYGDVLEGIKVQNDTIIIDGEPRGIIYKAKTRFDGCEILEFKLFGSEKIASYIAI